MEKKDEDGKQIIRRLDAIIHLLVKQQLSRDNESARNTIVGLYSAGLKDSEIASILGRSRGYVASEVSKCSKKVKNNE